MNDELIEQVARAIDPEAWEATLPIPTRGETYAFYAQRLASVIKAKAAIAAMQPHIAAQREDAARRALEAAIKAASNQSLEARQWLMAYDAIRAIDPAQFRTAAP